MMLRPFAILAATAALALAAAADPTYPVGRIQTPQGDEVKESVGALPTHILAPGNYTVIAKSQGRVFQRDIALSNGETTQVELIMK